MVERRSRPFSRPLQAEKKDGILERGLDPTDHAIEKAKDAVLKRADPLRVRYLGMTSREQGLVLVGAGAIVTVSLWALALFAPQLQRALAEYGWVVIARTALVVGGPATFVYGALRLTIPEVEAPPAGARFGGVLTEARDAGRWKMQLVAIAVGLVHFVVFANLL
jgi:hypothetical protein